MKNKLTFLFALGAAAAFAETVSVKSPDGLNEIALDTDGGLSYRVLRSGKTLIAPTPLSITIEGKGTLGAAGVVVESKGSRAVKGAVATPIYKKSSLSEDANEATVSFQGGWKVVLRARNDGVAYRFVTSFPGKVKVLSEEAGVTFPSKDVTTYVNFEHGSYKGDKLQNSWETVTQKLTAGTIPPEKEHICYLPLLAQYDDGTCLVVEESDLLDYPGWNLAKREGDGARLSACMARYPDPASIVNNQRQRRITKRFDYLAETDGARSFPWRVFAIAPCAAKLVEGDIVYALATPCRLKDTSWVKPGKVAWDWWNDWNVSGVDFRAGCNTATYKHYIDFASENGVEYVIMDEGWSKALRVMEINPAIDMEGIVKHGEKRGVGIILWCSWPQLVGRQHEVFKRYSEIGVKGFKIDFMDRDDQFVEKYFEETAAIAAQYRLLVDYHGMHKPTGLHRTYPNVINYEGVYGLEQLKWTKFDDMPGSDVKTVFVRMSAGPLDYTPGSMINQTKRGFKANYALPTSQGTRCHQIALFTLFEAPLQMLCDSPTQYRRNQECFNFMRAVPTVWDETVGLAGDIDKFAAVARRKGDVWYVSSICGWTPQTLKLPTSFLGGGEWEAEIFEDGVNADRDATDYVHRRAVVKAGEPIEAKMSAGGGFAVRLARKGAN